MVEKSNRLYHCNLFIIISECIFGVMSLKSSLLLSVSVKIKLNSNNSSKVFNLINKSYINMSTYPIKE